MAKVKKMALGGMGQQAMQAAIKPPMTQSSMLASAKSPMNTQMGGGLQSAIQNAQAAKQKLALQPNGTFAPAGKSNLPPIGPIGGKNMPPPNTGGMIATPPPGMGSGTPPPSMGGRLGAPSGMPPPSIGGQLGAASGAPAMGGPPPQANLTSMAGLGTAAKGMKKGGSVKASKMGAVKQSKPSMGSASKRGDGIAQRGKTKGRIV